MEEQLKLILEDYYTVLKINPSRRRHKYLVQARAAMMVAMRKYTTTTLIARVFDMDHSSIVYHSKMHDANMVSWDGYAKKFRLARRMCNSTLRFKTMAAKLKSVRGEIVRLKKTEELIVNQFKSKNYEQLQVQNDKD